MHASWHRNLFFPGGREALKCLLLLHNFFDFLSQVELFSGICLCGLLCRYFVSFPSWSIFHRRLEFMIESTQKPTMTAYNKSFRLYFINVNHVNEKQHTVDSEMAEIIIRRRKIHGQTASWNDIDWFLIKVGSKKICGRTKQGFRIEMNSD